jgi:hypothetical protein
MTEAERIAAGLSTKAKASILHHWPVSIHRLHNSHRRHFNRNQLIEPSSLTQYRLTPLGLAVRKVLERSNDTRKAEHD